MVMWEFYILFLHNHTRFQPESHHVPTNRKRPTFQTILDEFLAGHGLRVRRAGRVWTYTHSKATDHPGGPDNVS